jgi:hypothetical protein
MSCGLRKDLPGTLGAIHWYVLYMPVKSLLPEGLQQEDGCVFGNPFASWCIS